MPHDARATLHERRARNPVQRAARARRV